MIHKMLCFFFQAMWMSSLKDLYSIRKIACIDARMHLMNSQNKYFREKEVNNEEEVI